MSQDLKIDGLDLTEVNTHFGANIVWTAHRCISRGTGCVPASGLNALELQMLADCIGILLPVMIEQLDPELTVDYPESAQDCLDLIDNKLSAFKPRKSKLPAVCSHPLFDVARKIVKKGSSRIPRDLTAVEYTELLKVMTRVIRMFNKEARSYGDSDSLALIKTWAKLSRASRKLIKSYINPSAVVAKPKVRKPRKSRAKNWDTDLLTVCKSILQDGTDNIPFNLTEAASKSMLSHLTCMLRSLNRTAKLYTDVTIRDELLKKFKNNSRRARKIIKALNIAVVEDLPAPVEVPVAPVAVRIPIHVLADPRTEAAVEHQNSIALFNMLANRLGEDVAELVVANVDSLTHAERFAPTLALIGSQDRVTIVAEIITNNYSVVRTWNTSRVDFEAVLQSYNYPAIEHVSNRVNLSIGNHYMGFDLWNHDETLQTMQARIEDGQSFIVAHGNIENIELAIENQNNTMSILREFGYTQHSDFNRLPVHSIYCNNMLLPRNALNFEPYMHRVNPAPAIDFNYPHEFNL